MGWASHYISKLQEGETVEFRPKGSSMSGLIESGQLCTVVPITANITLDVGNVVLCKVKGREYLHLIKAIRTGSNGNQYQIGNNRGGINGWVNGNQIFGKCTKVSP